MDLIWHLIPDGESEQVQFVVQYLVPFGWGVLEKVLDRCVQSSRDLWRAGAG